MKPLAVVADPLWYGHHPMFFSQTVASFQRAGADVLALCPDPDAASAEYQPPSDEPSASHPSFRFLPPEKHSPLLARFNIDPFITLARWKELQRAILSFHSESGRMPDVVFFPYLDVYLRFLPLPFLPGRFISCPWTGIYFRNHHYGFPNPLHRVIARLTKGDRMLKSDLCQQIGTLDERYIPGMERFTGSAVQPYPDFTFTGLPRQPHPLASVIRQKADGRKIVGMIGIERRKGFINFLRTAELARKSGHPLFFAVAGAFHPGQFPAAEKSYIHSTIEKLQREEIDNLHFDPSSRRIPLECDFNSIFSTFDIAWAAYENFHGSSNTLGKAAHFRIPCLASKGQCVGHRIESYRTGLTIPEGDSSQALAALLQLTRLHDWNSRPLQPRYDEFTSHHSLARLDQLTSGLLRSLE